ncbi:MAG: Ig-like domain-containing protein [Acidobacteriota bacterium]|nr:Ig-like domain-containing protein [Acidobacteriota bacterium]MDH3785219.1 Ig-like domain-containing protein [Acidobacteriota bacterium]
MLQIRRANSKDPPHGAEHSESKSVILLLLLVLLNVLILSPINLVRAAEPYIPEDPNNAPFKVQRTVGDASMVREAQAHVMVFQGPHDDDVGVLDDGALYFYVIEHPIRAVTLSVHKNEALGTVRLGFDDGKPSSAAVNVAWSGLTVRPSDISADGATAATVTIVPRDGFGTPLGAGLRVLLDEASLLPGTPVGPVVDEGNGRYTVQVVSSTAGAGSVVVIVEDQILADQPTVTYKW